MQKTVIPALAVIRRCPPGRRIPLCRPIQTGRFRTFKAQPIIKGGLMHGELLAQGLGNVTT
jgi:hypothetical protein